MTAGSHLWIKICGNTSLEDAQLAADAGADAVGFVFAPSARHVTPAQVAAIVPHLPASIEKIGVFVDAGLDQIRMIVQTCGLTGVQLHFDAASELPAQLRAALGRQIRILRVVHFSPDAAEPALRMGADPSIDAILVDSRTATATGGTGTTFSWNDARSTLFESPGPVKLIAAGGLTPENVLEAISILRPWGVDVASGVESAAGRKHPGKIRAFVSNARNAGSAERGF
jgi:phosphoribosylanthranilate isomerase